MALSATATSVCSFLITHSKAIVKDIKTQLAIPNAIIISESFDRPNIFYTVGDPPFFTRRS